MVISRFKATALTLLTVLSLVLPVSAASAVVFPTSSGSSDDLAYSYSGTITSASCSNPARGEGYLGDVYRVSVNANVQLYLKGGTSSPIGDPFLQVVASDRTSVLAQDDDSGQQTSLDSFIRSASVTPNDFVIATTYGSGVTGSYVMYSNVPLTKVTTCPQVISFAQPSDTSYGSSFNVTASTNMGLPVTLTSSTTSTCTVSNSAAPSFTITAISLGTCTLVATQSGSGSTGAAPPVSRSFSIGKKNLTVTGLSVQARPYDGTTTATLLGTATLSGVVAGDSVTLAGTASTVFPSANAGSYTLPISGLSITGSSIGNYNLVAPTVSTRIDKISQTISWAPTQALLSTDSGSAFASASTSGDGAITYSVVTPGTAGCTVSGLALSFTAEGNCTVRATAASTTNYNLATRDVTFSTTWLSQTITWNPVQSLIPSDTGTALNAATTSGNGAISYSVQNAGTAGCAVTGNILTFTDAGGTCVLRATAARTSIYNAATKDLTFTVTRLTQELSWDPARSLISTDSGLPFAAATTTGDGALSYTVQDSGTAGCSVSGRSLSFTSEGTCVVRATAARTTNYDAVTRDITFTTTWLNQNLSWSTEQSLIPSDSGATLSGASTTGDGAITYSVQNAGTAGCGVTGYVLTFSDSGGTCVLRATAARTSTFNAATKDLTFTVNRLSQSVSWSPTRILVPSNSGDSFETPTSSGDGSFSYEVVNAGTTGCSVTGSALSFSGEGNCTVRATAARTTDYDPASRDVTFIISKLNQVISWSPSQSLIPSDTGSPFALPETSGDGAITYTIVDPGNTECSVAANTLVFNDEGGTCVVRATAASTTDFNVSSVDVSFTIMRLAQVISWSPITEWKGTESGAVLSAATTSADGEITYAVREDTGPNCSLIGLSLIFTGVGMCTLEAQASRTTNYNAALLQRVFLISRGSQSVSWAPTNVSARADAASLTPNSLATSSGSGVIRYSVVDAGGTRCTVNPTSGVIQFSEAGTCIVRATASQTATETAATADVRFTITPRPAVVIQPVTLAQTEPAATVNIANVAAPITTLSGEIPEMRGGKAMMLVNGVEQQVNVESTSASTLRATTSDGLVLNLKLAESQGGASAITDASGSLILVRGNSYSFVAEGFAPDSEIVIWLFSKPKKIGTTKTDLSGQALADISASLDLEPGYHTLQVSGTHADGSTRAIMLSVFVPDTADTAAQSTPSGASQVADQQRVLFISGAAALLGAAGIITAVVVRRRHRGV